TAPALAFALALGFAPFAAPGEVALDAVVATPAFDAGADDPGLAVGLRRCVPPIASAATATATSENAPTTRPRPLGSRERRSVIARLTVDTWDPFGSCAGSHPAGCSEAALPTSFTSSPRSIRAMSSARLASRSPARASTHAATSAGG